MITFIRKYLLNAYVALPMLMCFLLTSWTSFAHQNTRTHMTFLTGEDMFKGVFFLEGQYAQMLPEAQSLRTAYLNQSQNTAQKAVITQVRQMVMASIELAHPGYYAQFKSALKSGDAVRINQALTGGEALIAQAMDNLYHLDKDQLTKLQADAQAEAARQGGKLDAQALEKLVSQMQKGKALDVNNGTCLVTIIAVAVLIWVVIALAAEEVVVGNDNGHSLLREQVVASICDVAPSIA
ncbi:hypothetical protein [Spirosoma sp. KNUC1025]|uniref:hypothetical protein n=1 Tax=Spirosoma sp. KNUC1025 TaxID=2894082 RepID=UPI00386B81A4|nr:hypothetical protein LN737_02700 [Spirosoma sp. KNUC1025]